MAPELLCSAGGFSRSGVFVLRGGRLWAASLYFDGARQWSQRVLGLMRAANLTLDDFPFDASLLDERRVGIVAPRGRLPANYRKFIDETRLAEYVSVPILVLGRPAGFVAFDAYGSSRRLGSDDAERGAAAVELLSGALTRHLLLGRLQRIHEATGSLLDPLAENAGQDPGETAVLLSDREREVVALVERGLTNSEIADRLGISVTTVKTHLSRAFRKLGARSRAEAIALLRSAE